MIRRPSERVQAVLFVAILVAGIAGLYAAAQMLQPAAVPAAAVRSVRLDIEGSGWSVHYQPDRTTNNTAFGILLEASSELGFQVLYVPYEIPQGMFITAINGTTNGSDGRFWQYWVNGDLGHVAADKRELFDGDRVLWNFTLPQEGA